jgi:hypothetical protein
MQVSQFSNWMETSSFWPQIFMRNEHPLIILHNKPPREPFVEQIYQNVRKKLRNILSQWNADVSHRVAKKIRRSMRHTQTRNKHGQERETEKIQTNQNK